MATTPSPATCQSTFEQGVAYALHLWPALSLAVQNNWGGPDSSDKRDWFAGAIVELFPDLSKIKSLSSPSASSSSTQQPQISSISTATLQQQQLEQDEPDQEDVETVLLQVMLDEFEVNVDDDSGFEVAEQIMRVRAECARGKFDEVEALRHRWESKKGAKVVASYKQIEEDDGDTDWDSDDGSEDGDENDDDQDVEMGDAAEAAPELAQTKKEKEQPEVDEDGFTKVVSKKKK
ncbi:Pre-rRNA-processing protein TSR2-domain-containing protein [Apodospora peruviana]|uniref:Pre-rRNA-processing protein TSR2-domain-containing protein n=1 Tax=Apodospora peruviana TaxID=516989 RepID=A0AAE0M290_9PEZI|nr:Pre-rRNA-processing protein TSR2-domain-containing protein [Apodospora peruviana]